MFSEPQDGSTGTGVATLRTVRDEAAMVAACGLGERSIADFTFAAQVVQFAPPWEEHGRGDGVIMRLSGRAADDDFLLDIPVGRLMGLARDVGYDGVRKSLSYETH